MNTLTLRTLSFLLLGVLALGTSAAARDLVIKAPPQPGPIVIVNATVHPVSSPPIPGGYVAFEGGVITAVGSGTPEIAEGTRVVEADGLHVYPGLVSAYTQTGLTEIGSVRATHDFRETGSVSPEVRACVAVNPDSTIIPVTRANGVLTTGVFPSGGAIPGRASVIQLEGWTWEEMTVEADAGLVVAWPLSRPVQAWWMDRSDEEQLRDIRENMQRIEEAFALARAYHEARAADPAHPEDIRWEAMRDVFPPPEGGEPRMPVFIEANDYDQIVAAVSFAARNGLKAVLVGGRDAPLCADLLKRHGVGVIAQGAFRMPKRDDSPYDEPFTLGQRLEEAGLRWCLTSSQETAHERNLPYSAALAAAYGLDPDLALRAITLSAAELLGVGDRLGSLEPGKLATLIVTDGTPLEMTTRIHAAYIQGREIDLSNKQTELERKYREKYRQLEGAGSRGDGNGDGRGE